VVAFNPSGFTAHSGDFHHSNECNFERIALRDGALYIFGNTSVTHASEHDRAQTLASSSAAVQRFRIS
jgi:alpha-ketoglutarate-dependent taurine dioxygenase